MTISYTYEIMQLICEQKIDGLPDAVSGVHLRLTASDGVNERSSVVFVPVNIMNNGNYTPFADLTKETIESWVASNGLMNQYKQDLAATLSQITDPTSVNRKPPWVSEPPAPAAVPAYILLRRTAYPPVAEQLDMLWHAMNTGVLTKVTDFYDALKAVKDQYPKT